MAGSFIPGSLQNLWNAWNIRGFVLLSLFLQVLLASIVRLRKKSNNRYLVFVIWLAYFTADWAATFTFGLISNAQRKDSIGPVDKNHLAFWAAFLLIHLGGPDMITAYSLEDNALWMRHLVGLVAQLFTFLYIFLNTLPDNNLAVPTILIAVAGTFKYGEKTRALYLASMRNLKKSIVKMTDARVDNSIHGVIEDRETKDAFDFFQIFKGLVVDITPNHVERSVSREFILNKELGAAFRIIETELDLLYDLLYTKMLAISSMQGLFARIVTSCNVILALGLYCLTKKGEFHEADIWITFLLLASVILTETFSGLMLTFSNLSNTNSTRFDFMKSIALGPCFRIPMAAVLLLLSFFECCSGPGRLLHKSWCEKLCAFNLLSHCFGQYLRGDNKLKKYAHTVAGFFATSGDILKNAFNDEIWSFIFRELKRRALFADDADKVNTIFTARGSWTLMNSGNSGELMRYVDHFDYDKSLLVWHIATEICYNIDRAIDGVECEVRELAKILSDYMSYLLIKKPEMMSNVAGICHIRYHDTCAEIIHFCRVFESKTVNEFSARVVDELTSSEPVHEYKDKGTSVLFDACNLAIVLQQKDTKWEIIGEVWVEMLMYAAGHCRPEKHARAVSEGGELVTILWLLMAHFGIGAHFPYPED